LLLFTQNGTFAFSDKTRSYFKSKNMLLAARFLTILLLPLVSVSAVDGHKNASREEAVTFPSSDGFQLEGTLRLPSSASSANPVPGVVLIHGSGPASRDELVQSFGFSIPVFADIGNALQGKGIAVLTYDKRICSSLNGCYNNSYPLRSAMNVTVDDYIQDALAAVRFLQTDKSAIIKDIVIVGHSQAGAYIPVMLEQEPNVIQGGVMMAGTFRPFDDLVVWQYNFEARLLNLFGQGQINASCIPGRDLQPLFMQWLQAVRDQDQGQNGTAVVTGTVPEDGIQEVVVVEATDVPEYGLSVNYWKSLFDVHDMALAAVANIDQPLLVLHGDMDWTVPPSDAKSWSKYLEQAGNTNSETKILPCVTHLLNCITRFPYDIGGHVDPQVTDSLADFVLASRTVRTAGVDSSGVSRVLWRPTIQIMLAIAALAGSFYA
jgi:pimeloyl-ACP methyl ester carboxylesterase